MWYCYVLFNILLKHCVVPLCSYRINVPVLKNMCDDNTDFSNYSGIILSMSVSKLFEQCLLTKFGRHFFVCRQFGFERNYHVVMPFT